MSFHMHMLVACCSATALHQRGLSLRHMDTVLSTSDTERLERYSAMLLPTICHHKLSGTIGGAGEGTKQRLEAAFSSAQVQARLHWQTLPMNLPVSESGTHLAD
jgi:hypothetical protein